MTLPTPTPPAGWYPDPMRADRLRYWNGTTWEEATRPAAEVSAQHAQAVAPAPTGTPARPGPGGFAPASWGARAKGLTLDALILLPLQLILTTVLVTLSGWKFTLLDDIANLTIEYDPETGQTTDTGPAMERMAHSFDLPLLVFAFVTFATFLLYYQIGLTRKGTTIGGRRARVALTRADGTTPGQLAVLNRYLIWGIPTLVVGIPNLPTEVSLTGWVLLIVNYCWSLVDPRKQALMDKITGTHVIAT